MLEFIDQIIDRRWLLMVDIAWDIISFESLLESGAVILQSSFLNERVIEEG